MFCPKCKDEEFVEVFSTYNQSDIALIKSVLDGENVHYFFSGESTIMMIGAGSYARLLVKADEAERVREILQELGFLERV